MQHLTGHAHASVLDSNAQVVAWRQVQALGVGRFEIGVFAADPQGAAQRHGVTGVDAQVEQGVLQLLRVDADRPLCSQRAILEVDVTAGRAADQVMHVGNQSLHVHRLWHERLLARKSQ